jgi:hypothetical protein
MSKVVVFENLTLDGVMQAPGVVIAVYPPAR